MNKLMYYFIDLIILLELVLIFEECYRKGELLVAIICMLMYVVYLIFRFHIAFRK